MAEETKNAKPNFFASLFGKVKKLLNIGGPSLKLDLDPIIAKDGKSLKGKLLIASKEDSKIDNFEVRIEETISEIKRTANGNTKESKTHTIGKKMIDGVSLKAGEEKTITFDVPYQIVKTGEDDLKEMGGAFGAIGKLGAMATKQEKEFFVRAFINIKGSFGTSDSLKLVLQ